MGLKMGKFRQISTELWPLIYFIYLGHQLTNFLQNLYRSSYQEGVVLY